MPIVNMPDGTRVRFPDDMPREEIRDMIATKFPDAVKAKGEEALAGEGSDLVGAFMGGLDRLADGMTFGLAPKIRAAGRAALTDMDYSEALEHDREKEAEFRKEQPVASAVNEIGGTMLTGGGLMKAGLSATKLVDPAIKGARGLAARSAAVGADSAAIGATQAAGNDQDIGKGALTGFATGAVSNAALEPIAKALGRAMTRKQVRKQAPSTEALKQRAGEAYEASESAGVAFSNDAYKRFAADLVNEMTSEGIDKGLHPKTLGLIRRIAGEAVDGAIPGMKHMDILRQNARDLLKSNDAGEQRFGAILMRQVDEFMENVKPSDVVAGKNPQEALANLRQGRELWKRARKAEVIEEAIYKAGNQASGFENGLRTQFRQLLQNKKTRKMFSPDEVMAIEKVANGGPVENLLRRLGKFSFGEGGATNSLGGSIGASVGYSLGGLPGAIGVVGGAQGARQAAQAATQGNAELAASLARLGGDAISETDMQKLLASPDVRAAIARALAAGGLTATQNGEP